MASSFISTDAKFSSEPGNLGESETTTKETINSMYLSTENLDHLDRQNQIGKQLINSEEEFYNNENTSYPSNLNINNEIKPKDKLGNPSINFKDKISNDLTEVDNEKDQNKTFTIQGKTNILEVKDNHSAGTGSATSGDLTMLDLQQEIEKLTMIDRDTIMHRDPSTTYPIELLPMQQWKQVSKRAKKIIKDSSSNVSLGSINTVSSNNSYTDQHSDFEVPDFSIIGTDEKISRKKEVPYRAKVFDEGNVLRERKETNRGEILYITKDGKLKRKKGRTEKNNNMSLPIQASNLDSSLASLAALPLPIDLATFDRGNGNGSSAASINSNASSVRSKGSNYKNRNRSQSGINFSVDTKRRYADDDVIHRILGARRALAGYSEKGISPSSTNSSTSASQMLKEQRKEKKMFSMERKAELQRLMFNRIPTKEMSCQTDSVLEPSKSKGNSSKQMVETATQYERQEAGSNPFGGFFWNWRRQKKPVDDGVIEGGKETGEENTKNEDLSEDLLEKDGILDDMEYICEETGACVEGVKYNLYKMKYWVTGYDKYSQKAYFMNLKTGEVRWELFRTCWEMIEVDQEELQSKKLEKEAINNETNIEESQDVRKEGRKRIVYYSNVSKLTQSTPPLWTDHYDDDHDAVYYYNTKTEEVTWICPEGFWEEARGDLMRASTDEVESPSEETTVLSSPLDNNIKENIRRNKELKDINEGDDIDDETLSDYENDGDDLNEIYEDTSLEEEEYNFATRNLFNNRLSNKVHQTMKLTHCESIVGALDMATIFEGDEEDEADGNDSQERAEQTASISTSDSFGGSKAEKVAQNFCATVPTKIHDSKNKFARKSSWFNLKVVSLSIIFCTIGILFSTSPQLYYPSFANIKLDLSESIMTPSSVHVPSFEAIAQKTNDMVHLVQERYEEYSEFGVNVEVPLPFHYSLRLSKTNMSERQLEKLKIQKKKKETNDALLDLIVEWRKEVMFRDLNQRKNMVISNLELADRERVTIKKLRNFDVSNFRFEVYNG